MKIQIRLVLLPLSLLLLFGACTKQDHLRPAPNAYENCLLTMERIHDKIKIPSDSKLQAGDNFPGSSGKITDIIDIYGQKYAVGEYSTNYDSYQYDSQKRIIEHVRYSVEAKGATVYSYDYSSPNKLIQKEVHEGFPTQTRTATYDLDEYGFIKRDGSTAVSGDFLPYHPYKPAPTDPPISNGNLANYAGTNAIAGKFSTEFEYDLTKPNLPNPFPFFGEPDRNLQLKSTTTFETYTPRKVSTESRYSFDSQGKVVKKITINSVDEEKGLTITTYEYECP